jgi:hypothetical protein
MLASKHSQPSVEVTAKVLEETRCRVHTRRDTQQHTRKHKHARALSVHTHTHAHTLTRKESADLCLSFSHTQSLPLPSLFLFSLFFSFSLSVSLFACVCGSPPQKSEVLSELAELEDECEGKECAHVIKLLVNGMSALAWFFKKF